MDTNTDIDVEKDMDTDKNMETDERKWIFWSKWMRIEETILFYWPAEANIRRIRRWIASIRWIANNWKKRVWDTLVNPQARRLMSWCLRTFWNELSRQNWLEPTVISINMSLNCSSKYWR
jgi:hypothetical protein